MLQTIDFYNSSINWVTKQIQSYGHFQIEAKLRASISSLNFVEEYYLLSGVMAGNMYAQQSIIKSPVYQYQAILSAKHYKIFRMYADKTTDKDSHGQLSELFEEVNFVIRQQSCTLIDAVEGIKSASSENKKLNIVMQFGEWEQADISLHFPVKHLNVNQSNTSVQVETGPVMIPNNAFYHSPSIANILLAYTNFNTTQQAEFAILQAAKAQEVRTFSKIKTYPVDINFQKLQS